MDGARRLSQAISEGDGISVIVHVADLRAVEAAERQGAEGLALTHTIDGAREATTLPLLWAAGGEPRRAVEAGADAWLLGGPIDEDDGGRLRAAQAEATELGLECVVAVGNEEELAQVLERLDPEILLLAARPLGGESPLECVLELLPDVPAGKLAIAEIRTAARDDVLELERAGVDAVLVAAGDIAELVGGTPPQV